MQNNVVIVSLQEFYSEYREFDIQEYQNICPQCFRQAKLFIPAKNKGRLKDEQRKLAIYLLTAHLSLLTYKVKTGSGESGAGMVASANVGEVSVSYVQIPNLDNWSYWLAQTPYGLELLALFDMLTSAPYYIGGSLERVF